MIKTIRNESILTNKKKKCLGDRVEIPKYKVSKKIKPV